MATAEPCRSTPIKVHPWRGCWHLWLRCPAQGEWGGYAHRRKRYLFMGEGGREKIMAGKTAYERACSSIWSVLGAGTDQHTSPFTEQDNSEYSIEYHVYESQEAQVDAWKILLQRPVGIPGEGYKHGSWRATKGCCCLWFCQSIRWSAHKKTASKDESSRNME